MFFPSHYNHFLFLSCHGRLVFLLLSPRALEWVRHNVFIKLDLHTLHSTTQNFAKKSKEPFF